VYPYSNNETLHKFVRWAQSHIKYRWVCNRNYDIISNDVMITTQVYRENKWKCIMSDQLLPGDLVSIGNNNSV